MANYQFPLLTTPFGEAEWAYLTKPDTKFDELGAYKVNIIVPSDSKELKHFLEEAGKVLEQAVADATAEAAEKAKGGRKPKEIKVTEFLPWEELEDGRVLLKLKRKAKIITAEGETKEFTVPLVDGTNTAISPSDAQTLSIGNGSILRARVEVLPYYSPTQGAGVSFRLKDVQIKKLVKYASASGFDAVASDGDEEVYSFSTGGSDATGYETGEQPSYHV